MLGIAVDPNFNKNRRIYVASASTKHRGSGCKDNFDVCNGNIIMRFEVSKDMKSVSNRTDIVTDIQYKPFESDHPFGGPGAHNGNRLRFGPEGYLWATTGDRHKGDIPQHPTLLGGNVLRIDTDGKAHLVTSLQKVLISVCILMDTEMFKVSTSAQVTVERSQLSMVHGITTKLLH